LAVKCYFYGTGSHSDATEQGVISFAIPDIGVVYRTRWKGDRIECEYMALFALLEFLDSNSEIIKNQNLDILGDSAVVVYQLNGRMPVFSRLIQHYRRVERYRGKLGFTVSWTPTSLNRAAMGLPDLPPLNAKLKFDFSFAEKRHGHDPRSLKPGGSSKLW
jgi:hypothetical protein